jgi:hypothetical protein
MQSMKIESVDCCPQHAALIQFYAVGVFSAVAIAVPEPFLQMAAEIGA